MNQERFRFENGAAAGLSGPSFLCIGQPYAGTGWLQDALSGHPQISLPKSRNRGDYFCFNYHRGTRWYLESFADTSESGGVRHVGEIAPMYIYNDLAPSRIAAFHSIRKLIVLLRDPVSWFGLHYRAVRKRSAFCTDRARFLEHHANEFDRLYVHSFLALYLGLFDRKDFFFATTDDLKANDRAVKWRLAEFLDVDPTGFGKTKSFDEAPPSHWSRVLSLGTPPTPDWLFEELRARRSIVNEQTERLGETIGRDLCGWLID